MPSRKEVYLAIDSEREYQDAKKVSDHGAEFHSVEDFLVYMDDYLTEAKHVASRNWGPGAKIKTLDVLRKVVALSVACMEQHGAPKRGEVPVITTSVITSGHLKLNSEEIIKIVKEAIKTNKLNVKGVL